MTILKNLFMVLGIMTTISNSENLITPDNSAIQYFGRYDFSDSANIAFDWPGVYIQATFQGTSCKVLLKGLDCYDAFVDGKHIANLKSGPESATHNVISGLPDTAHQLLLVKRTESNSPSFFQGLVLDSGKTLIKPPSAPIRKIEFIGDSYTAGFSNESLSRECQPEKTDSVILNTTNTYKAFGPLCAQAFNAQYQVNAISGKGLVRNYNGLAPGKELPFLYDKTLLSSTEKLWDFSQWKADVVVIGIGINDFQADPPYADSAMFDGEYVKLLTKLRKHYRGVKFICCATKVWPTDALIPRIKSIVKSQKALGHKDVWYHEYVTENGALYGHPSIHDHQIIAKGLVPVIAQATGWK